MGKDQVSKIKINSPTDYLADLAPQTERSDSARIDLRQRVGEVPKSGSAGLYLVAEIFFILSPSLVLLT